MAKNLVIVESPAKAGTIEKYLGSDYKVVASMGHIRDLPASKLGVDVEADFEPHYIIPVKAKKTLKALKEALKGKKKVYLATDLDREGEAIAWHISQALNLADQKIDVARITFHEITKSAITDAIGHPGELNLKLVDAQQARRVLDRLVGYTLSPVLWKKIFKGLSAGRVQSVALRLIVDRERERLAFKPVEYWSLKAELLEPKQKAEFSANLATYKDKKIEKLTLTTEKEVADIVKGLEKATYIVGSVESKPVKRRPSAPYTTSTLQQDAVNRLGISAKRVMQAAQRLYEAGHITYMRTDSVNLASTAVEEIRKQIETQFGKKYVPASAPSYQSKAKNAQEAHEAIRPTHIDLKGEDASSDSVEQKVYELIRRRTLACQMTEAELEQTTAIIEAGEATFRASGQRIAFPGFMAALELDEKEENILPALEKGQKLDLRELKPEQHFTEPPPRFSEATLIKALEEEGIGRPSTYAPTIDTLIQRNYVISEQRRLVPQDVGYMVTDLLVKHFPQIVDTAFTASMEEKLDQVADGEAQYKEILKEFWKPFNSLVETEVDKIEKIDTTEKSDQKCPTCGAEMLVKRGRFGKFLACSKFPDCKTTLPLSISDPTNLICPHCGKDIIQKRARRGIFFGCSGYPDCTVAIWKKDGLPRKIEELEGEGLALPFKDKALESAAALPPEPDPAAKTEQE